MKKVLIIAAIIVLIIFFGSWPLSIIAKLFEWIGVALKWLAKVLDFFGWNGLV